LEDVRAYSGTSGFSYDEWHGRFYPAELPASERLAHYSARLASVEINNTFYQTPKPELLGRWRDAVGSDFRFALKAPRRITHIQRLKGSEESLGYFWKAASVLGDKLGPVLFQLPPFARKDTALLGEFLASLPVGLRAAFEFRNASWFDDEVYALLSSHRAALCAGDSDEDARSPPLVPTANFGYLRLRAPSYDAPGLESWCERILAQPWEEAYVYLKHEVLGPDYALFLQALTTGERDPKFPEPLAAPVAVPYALAKKRAAKKGVEEKRPDKNGVANKRAEKRDVSQRSGKSPARPAAAEKAPSARRRKK
jgi:uncharacterized protein YecE (DUF72 family)